jgi:outer membrane receptor protein involved in Fe transport
MQMNIFRTVYMCVVFALAASTARAQTSGRGVVAMSIEELLDVKVTSTTKTAGISIDKAPGIVRVFTRRDLDRYGFATLRDVLANVPGIQIQQYRAGHEAVWFRGLTERYNNKVLWLVDGVPLRDNYYGHQGIDEAIPLGMVERIEIISGPGGVLYGTNAFAGVVSITTVSAKAARESRDVRAAYGTYNTGEQSGVFAGGLLYGFVNHLKTSGFSPALNSDGEPWRHDQGRERTTGFFKIGGPTLEGTFSGSVHNYADTYRASGRDRSFERDPVYGSIRYQHQFTPEVNLKILGYYEYYFVTRTESRFGSPSQMISRTEDIVNTSMQGVDINLSYTRGRHIALVGTSYQSDRNHAMRIDRLSPIASTSPKLAVPGVSREDIGVFVQDSWSVTPMLDVTTGFRYDQMSDFNDQLSYRLAATGHRGSAYGKLLYGTAFRVPSYREYLDVSGYNFSLRPEHLSTVEGQVGYRFVRADVNVAFYSNRYHDQIREIFVDTITTAAGVRNLNDEYSINAEHSGVTGIELLGQILPNDRLTVTLGLSRLFSATETIGPLDPSVHSTVVVTPGRANIPFVAKYTGNALVDYRLTARGDHVGFNATGLSRRSVSSDYQTSVPVANRDASNADGFVKVDVFSTIPLSRRLNLTMRGLNVFDRRIFSPPFDNATGYDNQWPSRSFRAELAVRY